jgi:hypothetical protein
LTNYRFWLVRSIQNMLCDIYLINRELLSSPPGFWWGSCYSIFSSRNTIPKKEKMSNTNPINKTRREVRVAHLLSFRFCLSLFCAFYPIMFASLDCSNLDCSSVPFWYLQKMVKIKVRENRRAIKIWTIERSKHYWVKCTEQRQTKPKTQMN